MVEHIRLIIGRVNDDGRSIKSREIPLLSISELTQDDGLPAFTVRTPDHWIIGQFSFTRQRSIERLNMFWDTSHFITVERGRSGKYWTFQHGIARSMTPSGIIMHSDMLSEGEVILGAETLQRVWEFLIRSKNK